MADAAEVALFGSNDVDTLEPAVSYGLLRRVRGAEARKIRRAMDGDRHLRRAVTAAALEKFAESGGDVGDFQSFMAWLLEHSDELIAFISKLIALFSV